MESSFLEGYIDKETALMIIIIGIILLIIMFAISIIGMLRIYKELGIKQHTLFIPIYADFNLLRELGRPQKAIQMALLEITMIFSYSYLYYLISFTPQANLNSQNILLLSIIALISFGGFIYCKFITFQRLLTVYKAPKILYALFILEPGLAYCVLGFSKNLHPSQQEIWLEI